MDRFAALTFSHLIFLRSPILHDCFCFPAHDAPSPVSFERNTVPGPLLSMAGRFEAVAIIQQGFANWDISQRDPTIRSEQNLFGGRFVGRSLGGL
jgi:hypothetical protein